MLSPFGLSNYESKVYTKLLELGSTNARTISKSSQVPYGRIYDVLHNLENMGLLHSDNTRPQNFLPVEPEIAVNRLLEIREMEMTELTKRASLVTQKLTSLYENKPKDKLVWKVAIGDDLHKTYYNLLSEANKEFLGYVDITADMGNFEEEIEKFKLVIHNMNSRKVKIRILLGVDNIESFNTMIEANPQMADMVNYASIKLTSILPYPFTVIDGEKVLLKVINPSNPSEFLAAVYLWQNSLAQKLKQQFEALWESASPLKLSLTTENS